MESHKFLVEFIDLYKSHTCLWKYSCKDCRNKPVKDNAYSALLEKLQEIDLRADEKSVMRKINVLRTSFRREHKKVRRVLLQTKKKYIPSLRYYELLKFVVEKQDYSDLPPGAAILDWPASPQQTSEAPRAIDELSDGMKSDSGSVQIKLAYSSASDSCVSRGTRRRRPGRSYSNRKLLV